MKSAIVISARRHLRSSEGRGTLGCLVFLALTGIVVFAAIKVGPAYYSFTSFETDVKTEVSRAGAHFFDDETIMQDVLDLARRNEIRLSRNNVKIERFAGQMFVTVRYQVPVDLLVHQHTLDFEIKASSYIGRL